jgi:hypothetical protein
LDNKLVNFGQQIGQFWTKFGQTLVTKQHI